MLLRVLRRKSKEVRFYMIFWGHTLAPGVSRTPAAIILDLSMMSIFAVIMVFMIVTVFNMRFVFAVELQFDAHVLDDGVHAHSRGYHLQFQLFPVPPFDVL